ncbi:MAG: flagellar biosynthetic protein FliO [Pseudomonadota bacterium]
MSRMRSAWLKHPMAVAVMLWADTALAADAVAAPSAVGAGSLLQFGLGLAIVLGLILGAGWFMKRFSFGPTGAGLIKVIAGAPVGQRERVVVVEIGDTWMVLGVAPGRVNTLHTLPRGDHSAPQTLTTGAQPNFATWLKQTMDKRRGA